MVHRLNLFHSSTKITHSSSSMSCFTVGRVIGGNFCFTGHSCCWLVTWWERRWLLNITIAIASDALSATKEQLGYWHGISGMVSFRALMRSWIAMRHLFRIWVSSTMIALSKYTNGQSNIEYIKWILIMVHYPTSPFKLNGGLANVHLFCRFH